MFIKRIKKTEQKQKKRKSVFFRIVRPSDRQTIRRSSNRPTDRNETATLGQLLRAEVEKYNEQKLFKQNFEKNFD